MKYSACEWQSIYIYIYVAYWPPTRPSCQNRKCTCVNNRCTRSRNIRILSPWPWTGLMSAKLWRSQEEEWTSNYHITRVKTGSQSVGGQMSWRSGQLVIRCGRENQHPAEWPPGHRLSSPGERETLLWPIEWGSICCSSVRSPTPSHSKTSSNPFEPFQIKW